MEDPLNEDFCLPCLERRNHDWDGGELFRVHCDYAATCPPFPTSIEGTRIEYLALIATTDKDVKYPA